MIIMGIIGLRGLKGSQDYRIITVTNLGNCDVYMCMKADEQKCIVCILHMSRPRPVRSGWLAQGVQHVCVQERLTPQYRRTKQAGLEERVWVLVRGQYNSGEYWSRGSIAVESTGQGDKQKFTWQEGQDRGRPKPVKTPQGSVKEVLRKRSHSTSPQT